jgi:hypothetical protein
MHNTSVRKLHEKHDTFVTFVLHSHIRIKSGKQNQTRDECTINLPLIFKPNADVLGSTKCLTRCDGCTLRGRLVLATYH